MNASGDDQKKDIQTTSANSHLPFNIQEERLADIEDQKDRFLVAWTEMHNMGDACKFADVTRAQVNRWLAADATFKERYDDIHDSAVDRAEKRLFDLATDVETPAGAQVKALEVYLKANRPEKYSPNKDSGHGPIQINFIMGGPATPVSVEPVPSEQSPDSPPKMINVKAEHDTD